MSVKSHLSVWHIQAAINFASKAKELETTHAGEPFGDIYQEIASNAMATIFFAVATLEANVNELLKNPMSNIPEQDAELIKEIWNLFERKSRIFDKYDFALLLKRKEKLDKKSDVYKNSKKLITLRNELVHYKPRWTSENGIHRDIEQQLIGKFPLSPFTSTGDAFFPKRCMSYGCAKLAVDTALNFLTNFSNLSALQDNFAKYHSLLK